MFSGANALLFLYCTVYLERIRGVRDVDAAAPWAVPSGSVTMVSAGLLFVISMWPVFGLLSPFIVFLLSFGLLNAFLLIPHFGLLSVRKHKDS